MLSEFARILRPFRGTPLATALVVWLLAVSAPVLCTAGRALTPLAPVPDAPVWSDAYKSRQGLVWEAQARIRSLQKAALVPGDKTAAMDAYDVTFYDLDLDLDPVARILTGTVAMTAQVVADSLSVVQMNLDNKMTVSAARAAGAAAAFTHASGLLDVTLDRTYLQGETFTVAVDYAGDPTGDYFGWDTYNGAPLVWSLSEPYGAREWWPCKDVNTDKADSVDINVTVPDPLVVASNGLLAGTTSPAAGQTTYHWQERYPIVTYLVSVTAHPYVELNDTYTGLQGETMPLVHYVVADRVGDAAAGYAPTPDMIHTFALAYGEYPFINEKYGHAHFLWGGGMEHQTCSSMAYNYYSQTFVAHELSHQWWGDMVTCADFHHIWLNEGFATWSEAYWLEQSQGPAAYFAKMDARKFYGGGSVYVPDASDFNVIFDYWHSYAKASWVVHMLRHVMGDADFFAALAQYRQAYAFSSATTEDFQTVCEQVSGLDLGPFMAEWIYGEYYPAYEIAFRGRQDGGNWFVDLRISQTQTNTGVFTMPLDVRVTTLAGVEDFTVQNESRDQWYSLAVGDEPVQVVLDPDDWVLCTISDAGYSGIGDAPAREAELLGAYPNPFNPMTTIRFTASRAADARLEVFDVRGRSIRDLSPGMVEAGEHGVTWDGRDDAGGEVSSGTYFVRLDVAGQASVTRLTLVR